MRIGNFDRELSEQRVEQEKEAAIAAARSALAGHERAKLIGEVDAWFVALSEIIGKRQA